MVFFSILININPLESLNFSEQSIINKFLFVLQYK